MDIAINPSILSADFSRLGEEIARIDTADAVHVDVMDNRFVPNLTFGPPVVQRIVEVSPIPIDAHLMIAEADRHAPAYADLGCASVTFHLEASDAPVRTARELRRRGARASVAVRPATAIDGLLDILDEFDQVLVMTVEPGFGGQSFLLSMMPKVERLRAAALRAGISLDVQVDGGIAEDTIATAARAGANVMVAGSAVYGHEDPRAAIAALRGRAGSKDLRA